MYSSVTDICTVEELDAVLEHIETHAPQSRSPHWTPGWRGESEVALLDAIFSARAPYGGPTSGVPAVVQRWRSHRGDNRLDDLTTLAELATTPDLLVEILSNRQLVPGNSRTKGAAAAVAAQTLVSVGLTRSTDFEQHTDEQFDAFCAIPGLGETTWECMLVHLGVRTDKAAEHLRSFVADALEPLHHNLAAGVAEDRSPVILGAAANALGTDLASLEHAVWRYQHTSRRAKQRHSEAQLRSAGRPRDIRASTPSRMHSSPNR
ncbi:hypothetical protein [Rhodococcus sp. 14-2483-1-2]|uniref:hypothetical protein n=1 Tax=Rhodococcus sp. 14-2483-1-2 TaxID=2023147 RepID=UPI000B9A504A|nr:hypothetical protein [Rhodococcus sp. 14-2483-1-2]OZF28516.1 hypothetical protein CH295_18730 [Rhodococcus sp. 14-2483-1-2]